MVGCIDGWRNRQIEGRMDSKTDGQMDGWKDGRTDGQTDGLKVGWMNRWTQTDTTSYRDARTHQKSGRNVTHELNNVHIHPSFFGPFCSSP